MTANVFIFNDPESKDIASGIEIALRWKDCVVRRALLESRKPAFSATPLVRGGDGIARSFSAGLSSDRKLNGIVFVVQQEWVGALEFLEVARQINAVLMEDRIMARAAPRVADDLCVFLCVAADVTDGPQADVKAFAHQVANVFHRAVYPSVFLPGSIDDNGKVGTQQGILFLREAEDRLRLKAEPRLPGPSTDSVMRALLEFYGNYAAIVGAPAVGGWRTANWLVRQSYAEAIERLAEDMALFSNFGVQLIRDEQDFRNVINSLFDAVHFDRLRATSVWSRAHDSDGRFENYWKGTTAGEFEKMNFLRASRSGAAGASRIRRVFIVDSFDDIRGGGGAYGSMLRETIGWQVAAGFDVRAIEVEEGEDYFDFGIYSHMVDGDRRFEDYMLFGVPDRGQMAKFYSEEEDEEVKSIVSVLYEKQYLLDQSVGAVVFSSSCSTNARFCRVMEDKFNTWWDKATDCRTLIG